MRHAFAEIIALLNMGHDAMLLPAFGKERMRHIRRAPQLDRVIDHGLRLPDTRQRHVAMQGGRALLAQQGYEARLGGTRHGCPREHYDTGICRCGAAGHR